MPEDRRLKRQGQTKRGQAAFFDPYFPRLFGLPGLGSVRVRGSG